MREQPMFAQRHAAAAGHGADPTDPGGPSREVLAAALAKSSPPGDATVLSGGEPKPGVARLLVTAGPRKGAEFALAGPLITLGRAARNTIAIPDISISREHLTMEKRGAGFILLDRGSGNGTRVNGRRVRRRRLRQGDEIEIGDTTLRFLEPGGVIAWASDLLLPATPAGLLLRHRRGSLLAALTLAMMLVVAAAFVRRQRVAAQLESQARHEASHALALQKLREASALLEEGRSAEARGRLAVAAELDGADADIARAVQAAQAAQAEEERAAIATERLVPATTAAAPPEGAAARGPVRRPISPTFSKRRRVPDTLAARSRVRPAAKSEDRRALAARHLLAAMEFQADEELPRAAAHLRAAIESDPQSDEARAGLQRIADRAKEIYLRAYMAKDDDPDAARNGFQLVVEALPARDETAVKALHWMRKLDGEGAD